MIYNPMEMMICVAANLLEDGATVGVGTGGPCAAAALAQATHAPNLVCIFEAGGFNPQLAAMPISVGDSRTCRKAVTIASMAEVFEMCQQGWVDYAFLGGAQIDAHGNLNSTAIGNHETPKVRLPGSGGANDFASFCWRTVVMTPLDPRRFVEQVDFVTTPGNLEGDGARARAGLAPGTGPYRVITDLAVLDTDPESGRLRVESIHPGTTLDEIRSRVGFELGVHPDCYQTKAPTGLQLRVLREQIDPDGLVIGRP